MYNLYVDCLVTSTLMSLIKMSFYGVLNGTFVVHFDCLIYVALIFRFEYDCIFFILVEELLPLRIRNGRIIQVIILLLLLQLNTKS